MTVPIRKPLLRIPYTDILSSSAPTPRNATTLPAAISALQAFLISPSSPVGPRPSSTVSAVSTVLLTGAGLSVSSGLADYRGAKGTYRVNKTYRPIYFHEFLSSHDSRKRYWARSFLGWTNLRRSRPNSGHYAVRDLGRLGLASTVITQNVDSFHSLAHPDTPTIELHGYLRSTVCTTCRSEFPRDAFQDDLARLNPAWAAFLADVLASGALDTEDPDQRRQRGIRTNPDGDVDLPDAPYSTFRYPPCPRCLSSPPLSPSGSRHTIKADADGAWHPESSAGILKPAVVMFGESIDRQVKAAAEAAVDAADRMLVLATSLATYSAWRLAKRAKDRGIPVAIVNIGGVRGEEQLVDGLDPTQGGELGVRVEFSTDDLLPALVAQLRTQMGREAAAGSANELLTNQGVKGPNTPDDTFKDTLS